MAADAGELFFKLALDVGERHEMDLRFGLVATIRFLGLFFTLKIFNHFCLCQLLFELHDEQGLVLDSLA